MSDGIFDERHATNYDEFSPGDPAMLATMVEVLAELAGDGRALEFASGTGRVALPLQATGVEVHGIELSRPMHAQQLKKPGGDRVPVTIGDMTTTRLEGAFRVVFLVYNTIGNLLTQDEQVECFRNAAAHLEPGGHFVIEMNIPPLIRLAPGERHVVFDRSDTHVGIDEFDRVNQRLVSHHVWSFPDGTAETFDTPQRYLWPAEMDLMARIAGMELTHRWGDWDRSDFTDDSPSAVSVWTKP
ncbi:MAG: class I SAM-dependent methyltransferase [Actinomycetota bacterium]